jgi:hypothetical protein
MRLLLRVVLCLLAATTARNANGDRTIRFPEKSVGNLSIRPTSLGGFGYSFDKIPYEGWSPLAPAAGEVVIPGDHAVRLELNREATADFAWLDSISPDALDALSAYDVPIDDAGVQRLSRLTGIKCLQLDGTKVTSKVARAIGQFPKLQYLSLNDTPVGDDAMEAIAALPFLEVVGLYGSGVTDVGLKSLADND